MVKVALAPGQSNYYDEISGVMLSLAKKEVVISDGIETIGLINGVNDGKIVVVSGSFGPETSNYNAVKVMPTYYRLLKSKTSCVAKTRNEEITKNIVNEIRRITEESAAEPIIEEPIKEEVVIEIPITAEIEEVSIKIDTEKEPVKPVRKRKKKVEKEVIETEEV